MKKILLGLVLLFFASASASAEFVIDDFSNPQLNTGLPEIQIPLGDFGFNADRTLSSTGLGITDIDNSFAGELFFGAFTPGSFELIYDNFSTGFILPPVNSSPANLSFQLQGVSWAGSTDLQIEIEIRSLALQSIVPIVIPNGTVGENIDFLFSAFNPVVLSQIDTLILRTTGATFTGMFNADALIVTPEPSSLILGGIGLLVMGGYGYRRRRKPANTNAASA